MIIPTRSASEEFSRFCDKDFDDFHRVHSTRSASEEFSRFCDKDFDDFHRVHSTRSASEEFSRFCLAGASGWYEINTPLAAGSCRRIIRGERIAAHGFGVSGQTSRHRYREQAECLSRTNRNYSASTRHFLSMRQETDRA